MLPKGATFFGVPGGKRDTKEECVRGPVGRRRSLLKSAFFWRNIAFGTPHPTWARNSLPSRNSEIAQNGSPSDHDDVGWLHVEMQQVATVNVAECGADINRYSQCIADAQPPLWSGLQQLVQAGPFQVFHEKTGRPSYPEAAHDIGMGEREQDVGLALRRLLRPQHLAQLGHQDLWCQTR